MTRLTWDQVRAWRMARSHLDDRVPSRRLVASVGDVCGLHAQVQSSAELQVWARVEGATPRKVRDALWKRRTLVRSWMMRGTLHLLPAADLPLYVAVLRTHDRWWKPAWLRFVGLSAGELEAVMDAIRASLGGRPMTRELLAARVADEVGTKGQEWIISGWGELLKPAAFHGYLCSGPPRGQNVTFVRPDRWLGSWEEHDEREAVSEVVRRYLRAYGPATREDLGKWWGIAPAPAGRMLRTIEDEIEEVEVEGRRAWARSADLPELRGAALRPSVRLLGGFDTYVVGFRPRDLLVSAPVQDRVFRKAGWITPTILVDGRVAGVWGYENRDTAIDVTVEPFEKLSAAQRRAIEEEADALGAFLGAPAGVNFATSR